MKSMLQRYFKKVTEREQAFFLAGRTVPAGSPLTPKPEKPFAHTGPQLYPAPMK
jgi:hypothetical protein